MNRRLMQCLPLPATVLLASFAACAQPNGTTSPLPSGAGDIGHPPTIYTALALAQEPQGRRSRQRARPPRQHGPMLLAGCTVETWQRGNRRIGSSRRRYLDAATFGHDSCVLRPATGRRPWVEIVWSVGTVLDEAIDTGYSQTKALAFVPTDAVNPDDYTFQWRGACNSDAPTCRLDIGDATSFPREAVITVRQRASGAIVLERVVTAIAHRP